jgi:hypothetical protein
VGAAVSITRLKLTASELRKAAGGEKNSSGASDKVRPLNSPPPAAVVCFRDGWRDKKASVVANFSLCGDGRLQEQRHADRTHQRDNRAGVRRDGHPCGWPRHHNRDCRLWGIAKRGSRRRQRIEISYASLPLVALRKHFSKCSQTVFPAGVQIEVLEKRLHGLFGALLDMIAGKSRRDPKQQPRSGKVLFGQLQ